MGSAMANKRTQEREINRAFIDALREMLGKAPLYNAETHEDAVRRFHVEPRGWAA